MIRATFILLLTVLLNTHALSCNCGNILTSEFNFDNYENSTHIFTIRITNIINDTILNTGHYYEVQVTNSFKGDCDNINIASPHLFSSCSPPPLKEKQEYLFYINSDDQSPSSFGFGICTERDLILKPYNQYDLYNKYIEENYLESEKWRFEMKYKYQSRVLLILNKLKTTNSGIIKQNFIGAIPNWEKNTVTYQTDLLNFEGQFSNGKMNGIWKIYYPISYVDLLNSDSYLHRLWKKGYYKKGKKEGIWITIDENGKEKKEKYQNGEKKSSKS